MEGEYISAVQYIDLAKEHFDAIQLWFLELHDSPLELKGELQYLDENCHFRGEKMTILV